MDPFAVLGVPPSASSDEVAGAYRALAKRWHPDRGGGRGAERQMADINAAYDMLRAEALRTTGATAVTPQPERPVASRVPGGWLPQAVRRSLGHELISALNPNEPVRLVTPVATSQSPLAVLAVTDRRLLWLLDDLATGRVRSLYFRAIAGVEQRLRPPRRRVAQLRVQTLGGKRHTFSDLRPQTAANIAGLVAGTR